MAKTRKNPVAYLDAGDVAKLNKALRDVGNRASGLTLRKAAEAGAEVLAEEMRVRAPVDEGDLASNIDVEAYRLQVGRALVHAGVKKGEGHVAALQEFGTEHHPAQPFIRPALDTKKDEATKAVRDVLYDALKWVLS